METRQKRVRYRYKGGVLWWVGEVAGEGVVGWNAGIWYKKEPPYISMFV